jgi:hypothetical protein
MEQQLTNEEIAREWKLIPEWEDIYEVSNYGEVRSLERIVACNKGNRIVKGRLIKPTISKRGYSMIYLRDSKREYNKLLHRIVAIVYVPNPKNYPQINHIKGNKQDNRAWMLEWCTSSMNNKHAFTDLGKKASKTMLGKSGVLHHASKALVQYDLQNNPVAHFESIRIAHQKTGVNLANIAACVNNKRKTAGGFIWKAN